MTLLGDLSARLPFVKKPENKEYFFAVNIGSEKLMACLWSTYKNELEVVNTSVTLYASTDELITKVDSLLDNVLGIATYEPEKILFGVPDSWLQDDDLKEPQLKLLRSIVKELDLQPMAYVATSHALSHFLEKQEGAPPTGILVGIDEKYLTVTAMRGGKSDGSKVIMRANDIGEDLEKALLTFTDVEVLPSRILLYGSPEGLEKHKSQLLAFPLMSKLSFLHFPKVEILGPDIEIKSVALAGGAELNTAIKYDFRVSNPVNKIEHRKEDSLIEGAPISLENQHELDPMEEEIMGNSGFMAGDIMSRGDSDLIGIDEKQEDPIENNIVPTESVTINPNRAVTEPNFPAAVVTSNLLSKIRILKFKGLMIPLILAFIVGILIVAYLFLVKAEVAVYVEPKVLEKDTEVTADPAIKVVDEANKKIPGQVVSTQVTGTLKGSATGKKQIGDSAKGQVTVFNATSQLVTLPAGTVFSTDSGLKFSLDSNLQIASKSASAADPPTKSSAASATAKDIGPDSNITSATELKVGNYGKAEVIAKAEGNFAGGTSKEAVVVTDTDQKKLLATLADTLRKQAQGELQIKVPDKKILAEALSEEISKKSYSKNINDAASELSLTLTIKYTGTAYSDADLKTIVGKLINTEVPDNFELDLAETETQADVSKLEKDGRLIFLARFKAKLMPKIDTEKIRQQIKGKTVDQAADILRTYENVLGSDIKISPSLPKPLNRLPFLSQNIKISVSLK